VPASGPTPRNRAEPFGESLLVLALFALGAAAIFATNARTPVRDLYHVSGNGRNAAGGRVLVYLNWPAALAAVGLLIYALDRAGRGARVAAAVGLACCAVIVWPGAVSQSDLDAKPVNAVAAIGFAIACILTLRGARSIDLARGLPSDRWRVAFAALLALVAVPWLAADLGFSASSIRGLRSVYYAGQMWAPLGEARLHLAVHPGSHEGLDGMLLAVTALLLSRRLGSLRRPGVVVAARIYCAAMLAYGTANVIVDSWYEQLVKRGVLEWHPRSMILPTPTLRWAILLGVVAALALLVFRPGKPPPTFSLSPRWALALLPAVVAALAVGLAHDASASARTHRPAPGEVRAAATARLVFARRETSFALYSLRGDGTGLRPLTGGESSLAPDWSRTRRELAFQSTREGNSELFALRLRDGRLRRLTRDDAADGEPAWSPGGDRLAFVSDRSGDDEIWTIDANGTHLRRLTNDRAHAEWPAWSPDGRTIAYAGDRGGDYDLYAVAAGGGSRSSRLTAGAGDDRYPRWLPGGRRLVFESDRDGSFHLYTLTLGRPPHRPDRVTGGAGGDFGPAVSPDGRWIAFVSDRDGNDQLYLVPSRGGRPVRLTDDQSDKGSAAWVP
jgi:TolB protein